MDILKTKSSLTKIEQQKNFKYYLKLLKQATQEDYSFFAQKSISDIDKAIVLFLRKKFLASGRDQIGGTVVKYAQILTRYLNFVQGNILNVTPTILENYLLHLKKDNLSTNTINLHIACLKSFYRFLADMQILKYNPASILDNIKGEKSRRDYKVLNFDEIEAILNYAQKYDNIRNYLILKTLYLTGLRVAELVNLTWQDVLTDTQGRKWFKIIGKGNKARKVYIPKKLWEELLFYKANLYNIDYHQIESNENSLIDDFPIFPNFNKINQRLTENSVFKIIKKYAKLINKNISPHWFRHTFTTHAKLKGASITDLKIQLGHSNLNTTLNYEKSYHLTENPAGAVFDENN